LELKSRKGREGKKRGFILSRGGRDERRGGRPSTYGGGVLEGGEGQQSTFTKKPGVPKTQRKIIHHTSLSFVQKGGEGGASIKGFFGCEKKTPFLLWCLSLNKRACLAGTRKNSR